MRLKTICLIAFFALLTVSNADAQPYAVKNFEKFSGLRIRPLDNFIICLGTSTKPLECKPPSGAWDKVVSVPFISLSIPQNDPNVDKTVQSQVIDKYLGAAFYLGDAYKSSFLDSSCIPEGSPTSEALKSILPTTPVRSTGIAQLVEEEIVREARVKFRALVEANRLGNQSRLDAAFDSALRTTIKGSSSNKADVKWVTAQLQGDIERLKSFQSLKPCIDFAGTRNGSIVTGIAGFVIMSTAGSSDYVSSRSFEQAAKIAFTANATTLPSGIDTAVFEAATSWSSNSNKRITTSITTNSPQPTFYPLWVSFTRVN